MASSFDSSIYINITALEGWRSKMSTINNNAETCLDTFVADAGGLSDSWNGSSADAFTSSIESFINNAKSYHETMSNIDTFLEEVVLTAESE